MSGSSTIIREGILYTRVKVAARHVGLVPDYVSRMCRENNVRAIRHAGMWYVDEDSLAVFLKTQAVEHEHFRQRKSEEGKRVLHDAVAPMQQRFTVRPHSFFRYALAKRNAEHQRTSRRKTHVRALAFAIPATLTLAFFLAASASMSPFLMRSNDTSRSQTAAASFGSPWFDSFASNVYLTFCPYFSDCPEPQKALATRPTETKTVVIEKPQVIHTTTTQPIIERVMETVRTVRESGITEALLDARLAVLSNRIDSLARLLDIRTDGFVRSFEDGFNSSGGIGGSLEDLTISNSSWTGGTITNATITGGSVTATAFSGVLPEANGGTGNSTYVAGDILYADAADSLATLAIGGEGEVLKVVGGVLDWATDSSGSGGSSAWATSTNNMIVYPADTNDIIVIGASATSTTGNILEVVGNSLFRGALTAYNTITAPIFTATSTSATSTLPNLTSSALSIGSDYITDFVGSGLTLSGSTLTLNATGDWTGTFDGLEGSAYLANSFSTTSAQYFVHSSTTIPKTYTANTFTNTNTFGHGIFSSLFASSASTTNATTTNLHITGLSAGGLAVDANGKAYSFATSSWAFASSTLLADNNTFSGSNAFTSLLRMTNGFIANASSTIGNDTQAGGLTISGGATTTGNAYFAGNVGIGTTSPYAKLSVVGPVIAEYFHATSTNATSTIPTLSLQTGLNIFGTFANSLDDLCTAITGGTGLCDGTDSTGSGGSGLATSTDIADTYVIYGTSANDVGAEAAFTYDDATNLLSVQRASTTVASAYDGLFVGRIATTSIRGDGVASIIPFASSTALTVSGTGYFGTIGIGTTSPWRALSVVGSSDLGNNALAGYFTATTSIASIFPFASTTMITATTASTTNLVVSALGGSSTRCLQVGADGSVSAAASGCGSGGGTDFSFASNYGTTTAATSSAIWAQVGIYASSTSHFVSADFTAATTTHFAITNLPNSLLATNSLGTVVATSSIGINLLQDGVNVFIHSSTTIPKTYTTNTFTLGQTFSGGATTTTFAITGITSALLKTNGSGSVIPAVADVDYVAGRNPFDFQSTFGAVHAATTSPFWARGAINASSTVRIGQAGTTTLLFDPQFGNLGIGTSSPFAFLSIHAASSTNNMMVPSTLLAISSSTASFATSTLFSVSNTGVASTSALVISNSPSGLLQTNGAGVVSAVATSTLGLIGSLEREWSVQGNGYLAPTTTTRGIIVAASSTIGAGEQTTGLTISGGATTTGNAYFAGNLGIGTISPSTAKLSILGSANSFDATIRLQRATDSYLSYIQFLNSSGFGKWSLGYTGGAAGFPTNDDFAIWEDESASGLRLIVKAGGNIGLGESSPGSRLSVSGNATVGTSYDTTAAPTNGFLVEGTTGIGTTSPWAKLSVFAGGDFASQAASTIFAVGSTTVGTATSTHFAVLSSGSVGVGTTTPTKTFSVAGNGYFGGSTGTTTIEHNGHVLGTFQVGSGSVYLQGSATSTYSAGIQTTALNVTSTSASSTFANGIQLSGGCFRLADGNCATSNAGTVIGTGANTRVAYWSAASALTSNANFTFDGTSLNAPEMQASSADPFFYVNDSDTSTADFRIGASNGQATIMVDTDNSSNSSYLAFGIDGSERMRLESNGRLGIGTTTPATALSVVGSIYASTTATSTFQGGGINLITAAGNTGCFAINGTCVSSGSSLTGTQGQVAYFSGTNTAVGTSSLFIATNGNVGVGTTTPTSKLAVQATSSIIGSELITNGSFTGSATGWTLGANATYGSNQVTVSCASACSAPSISQDISTVEGSTYLVEFDFTGAASSSPQVYFFNNAFSSSALPNAHNQFVFTANFTGTDTFVIDSWTYAAGTLYTIDNVSVREVSHTPSLRAFALDGSKLFNPGDGDGSSSNNVSFGHSALRSNTLGDNNTAVGLNALFANTIGFSNTAIGSAALTSNTTGDRNIAIGENALFSNTTSDYNIAIGASSLKANTTGFANIAIGAFALDDNTTNARSIAVGYDALGASTGANNIALGYQAGNALSTGANNIIIGHDIDLADNTWSNRLNIGNLIFGTGIDGTGTTLSSGSIGIGTTTPQYALTSFSSSAPQLSLASAAGVAQWAFRNAGGNLYIATTTAAGTATTSTAVLNIIGSTGKIGIGTTTPRAMLSIDKSFSAASTITHAGIDQHYAFTMTGGGTHFGNNMYIVNNPSTDANTLVGSMIRVEDSTELANVVRGLEVQAHRGTNTAGENTAISGFGRTFGVRGVTEGDAGSVFYPAGLFGETRGTTQGHAIRAYSESLMTGDLVSFLQKDSTFTGTGLKMEFASTTGSFLSGNFVDLQNAGVSKFVITSGGNVGIGTTTQIFPLTSFSTSSAQLSLAGGTGIAQWTLRNAGANLYFATTTGGGTATTSLPAFTIQNNGNVGIATSSPGSLFSINGVANFQTGTSTLYENLNVQGQLKVGSGSIFLNGAATSTFTAGINLTGGCFAVNGTCVGGSSSAQYIVLSRINAISASTTWSKPSDLSYVVVEVWGAGGGGGGGDSGAGGTVQTGGGGGGGGYAQKKIRANELASTVEVDIGAAGTASGTAGGNGGNGGGSGFRGHVTADGGGGGTGSGDGNTTVSTSAGGAGGTATNGDINLDGKAGGASKDGLVDDDTVDDLVHWGGAGGNSPRGGSGGAQTGMTTATTDTSGVAGGIPGGGGSGGVDDDGTGSSGGAGAAGMVIVYEYTSTTTITGADLAENYPIDNPLVEAGDIVAFDTGLPITVKRAVVGGGRPLAGVVSTRPGIVLAQGVEAGERPVALSGRVPVKFSNENGPVAIGDRIALSSIPGVGKKAGPFDDSVGIVIAPIEHGTGGDTVMIFLDLRPGLNINALAFTLLGANPVFGSLSSSSTTSSTTASMIEAGPLDFVGGMMHALAERIDSLAANELAYIATTTATTTDETTEATSTEPLAPTDVYADRFVKSIFSAIARWLSFAGNGIADLFAKNITAENVLADSVKTKKLCVADESGENETCITKAELDALLDNAGIIAGVATSTPLESVPPLTEQAATSTPQEELESEPEPEEQLEPEEETPLELGDEEIATTTLHIVATSTPPIDDSATSTSPTSETSTTTPEVAEEKQEEAPLEETPAEEPEEEVEPEGESPPAEESQL